MDYNITFKKLEYCEVTNSILDYPDRECELIIVTSKGEYIHCVSVLEYDHTLDISYYTIEPFDDSYDRYVEFRDAEYYAYLT